MDTQAVRGHIRVRQGLPTPPQPPARRRVAQAEVGQTSYRVDVVVEQRPRIADDKRRKPLDPPATRRNRTSTTISADDREYGPRAIPAIEISRRVALIYIAFRSSRLPAVYCTCVADGHCPIRQEEFQSHIIDPRDIRSGASSPTLC